MKYMTFNSSCAYAGVANMLEQYGVDTTDRAIAMAMKLPYLFSYEDGVYLAGPMLQSAQWFNLYLNTIGFEMIENEVPAEQVPAYLKRQKSAMIGLQVDGGGKHAVMYTGIRDFKLQFINNKWENTDAPEEISLSESELISQIGSSAMIATLNPVPVKSVDLMSKTRASVAVIRQNLWEIQDVCSRKEPVGQLRSRLNTLFRPLFLEVVTMLNLIDEATLANRFASIQRSFLNAIRQDANIKITLADYLNMNEFADAVAAYIHLIEEAVCTP